MTVPNGSLHAYLNCERDQGLLKAGSFNNRDALLAGLKKASTMIFSSEKRPC